MTRDIAGVGDERDAASRAPPGRMGGRAPAARAREAPDGRGERAGGCRQARNQSSDRLERNLLVWAANEMGGHGGRGRRASPRWPPPPNADKWDGHIVQWAESSASEPPRPKLTSQIHAAPPMLTSERMTLRRVAAPQHCRMAISPRGPAAPNQFRFNFDICEVNFGGCWPHKSALK